MEKLLAKFLRRLNKIIIVRLILLSFGFLGTFFVVLPDILPNSSLISLPPCLAALDAGFADLNQFDEVEDETGNAISILRKGDRGYEAIYDLVRTFNPNISLLGIIRASKEIEWKTANGSIPIFRPVLFLEYKAREIKPVPICDLRDLAFLIRDYKTRFWAGFGVTWILIVLFLQLALEVISVVPRESVITPVHLNAKETVYQPTKLGTSEAKNESKLNSEIWGTVGILFLIFSFFLLLARIRRGEKS